MQAKKSFALPNSLYAQKTFFITLRLCSSSYWKQLDRFDRWTVKLAAAKAADAI